MPARSREATTVVLFLLAALPACAASPQSASDPTVIAVPAPLDAAAPAITAPTSASPIVPKPSTPLAPSTATGTRLTDDAIIVDSPIAFAVGGSRLSPESDVALDAVRDILVARPSVMLEVQVHTDNQGSAQYNLSLSAARADAVVNALVARGIDAARLRAHGYGETQPLYPNDSPEHRLMNRRVALVRIDPH